MRAYYHLSKTALASGTVLTPVAWARQPQIQVVLQAYKFGPTHVQNLQLAEHLMNINLNRNDGTVTNGLTEIVFETVRDEEFATRTSRLRAVYLFPDLGDVNPFRERYPSRWYTLYEVSGPEELDAQRLDMKVLDAAVHSATWEKPMVTQIEGLRGFARQYWQGEPNNAEPPVWEILTKMPVTVVRQL
ncbi:MAG: hypothetical protein WEB00_14870 [Dehalococcoidia bacterium]